MKNIHAALLSLAFAATVAAQPAATPATKSGAMATPAAAAPAKLAPSAKSQPLSSAEILAASAPTDWRDLVADSTLVMELPSGTVVLELATDFAPRHAANIRQLVRAGYFDGLAIIRVQENYVTQWGDPAEDDAKAKPKPADLPKVPAEFDRALAGLKLTVLPDKDPWAAKIGFADGFPVAADPKTGRAWLPHCNGIVGAGRGDAVDSSDGSSLYVAIGHSPRGLDLNITTVGRVVQGMERLSALPRGTGPLGFYEKPAQQTPIARVRLLADIAASERPKLQLLRTDTKTWAAWLDSRRNRSGWFVHNPGRVDLCSVLPPVRTAP